MQPATATTLLFEDFDGLNLTPYTSPTEIPSGTGTDWTASLPSGWGMTFSGPAGDPIEFQGWRVHRIDSWVTTEEDQDRSTWANAGVGTGGGALLVDPDAYDDGTDIDTGLFNSWVTTPAIDLSTVPTSSVSISFDSFWKNEVTQTGTVDVSYDGGANYTNILTYDPSTIGNGAIIDRRESFSLNSPETGSLVFRFGMTQASNDWWWAIDNVEIETESSFKIQVDRDTGEIKLAGDNVDSLSTQGYSVFSDVGALNSDIWQSVASTGDANSGGSFDPNRNWVEFTAPGARGDLSEGVLGATTIAGGTTPHSFGDGVWIRYWEEDLRFEYLNGDGELQQGIVEFVGNGNQPFGLGDLTFDGVLNHLDWLAFQDGLGGEFSGSSIAEAYQFGDLNADLETDYEDFVIFQQNYDVVNGPGAFAAMLSSIPEPSPVILIFAAALFAVTQRRPRPAAAGALLAWSLLLIPVPSSQAQILLSEDFEGLPLLDSSLVNNSDNTDWTNVGPTGWITDDRNTPSDPARPEFQGWTFLDQDFWIAQQGNQAGRADFLPGLQPNNTIAVVDPDAHDDFIDNDPDQFSSVLTSPVISLTGIAPESIQVSFDSTWVPEDLQEAQFNVVIDGVRTNLFTWDSEPNANFKPAATNERIELAIDNPAGASELVFEWDMVEAGNDWWWGIDNVLVESVQVLNLLVNPSTGATSIQNNTGATLPINYYEIQSPSGSLNPDDFPNGWHSLDDQDYDAIGSGIGQSWDEGNLSDAFELVEAYLLGASTLANGSEVSIGDPYVGAQGTRDLQFFYATPLGELVEGKVFYSSPGDFNGNGTYGCEDIDLLSALIANGAFIQSFDLTGDGILNQDDITAWLAEAGAAGLDTGNAFLPGDANLDGSVDATDFGIWAANRFSSSTTWCEGDWNADGVADLADLHVWNENKFSNVGNPLAVPEPGMGLFWFGCLSLLGVRSSACKSRGRN